MNKGIIIFTEGGRDFGFGHVARCLALYQALKVCKFQAKFIVNADSSVTGLLSGVDYKIRDWVKGKDKLTQILKNKPVVVVDSYLAGTALCARIADLSLVTFFLDDNDRLSYPPGIVVNGSIYADKLGYKQAKVKYLLGPEYAMLRRPFWTRNKKRIRKNISNVLVTMGGADMRKMTPQIMAVLNERQAALDKKVVIAGGFGRDVLREIEKAKDGKTELIYYPDAKKMKELMCAADIAVSGAGQTLYELASAGVSTITVSAAENQFNNAGWWHKACSFEYIGDWKSKSLPDDLERAFRKLSSQARRQEISRRASQAVDGQGALRVAQKIMMLGQSADIRLRRVSFGDSRHLWLWRNHPEIRKWCVDRNRIKYEDHVRWFASKLKDRDTCFYIAEHPEYGRVGQIRFESDGSKSRVNINLCPSFLKKGLGNIVIKEGTGLFMKENPVIRTVCAQILPDNKASQKAFVRAGYKFSHCSSADKIRLLNFKFGRENGH